MAKHAGIEHTCYSVKVASAFASMATDVSAKRMANTPGVDRVQLFIDVSRFRAGHTYVTRCLWVIQWGYNTARIMYVFSVRGYLS